MSNIQWFVRPHVHKEYGDPDCCRLAIFDSDEEERLMLIAKSAIAKASASTDSGVD